MNWTNSTAGIKSVVITLSFVFLFIVAVLLDLQYLYLMAVTLAVLPLSSYGLAYFCAARYTARRIHPDTVPEGRRVEVTLMIEAQRGLPQPALRLADEIPVLLHPEDTGAAPPGTSAPLAIWDGERGSRTYVLEPRKRGVYTIGPARLETTDPLGLFSFTVNLPVVTEMVVHPVPIAASQDFAVGGEGSWGVRERDGRTRRGEGMDFHGVREYRVGDALRRVHWPTTARRGKLAVVEFERAYQQDIVIGLDLMSGTEHGKDRETTLEYAVKIAATLADRTLRAGGGVTLVTQAGRVSIHAREGDQEVARFRLYDLLARAKADYPDSLAESLMAARIEEGAYYAILTAQGDPRLTAYLTRRIQVGDQCRVYYLEPSSFGGPQGISPAVFGGELRVITHENNPWKDGGSTLEYLLRETGG